MKIFFVIWKNYVALEKLPNLEHLEKLVDSVQKIADILGKLTNADEAASTRFLKVRDGAKSMSLNVFLEVKSCSKAISALSLGHGKSPCFSEVTFLRLVGPDYPLLILPYVEGAKNMECAF